MMDPTIDAGPRVNPDALPSLRPGTVIAEQYVIEEQIGEGGMGEVYRATQRSLGREVALKLLRRDSFNSELDRRRLLREARVASALRHPNAVKIYDVGQDGLNTYIAMELVGGSLLSDVLEDGPIEPKAALRVVEPIADVLVAAHSISMVHRDLKPGNLFIEQAEDDSVRVRVVDFGLALLGGEEPSERLTAQGCLVGTPAYLSPEQAKGEVVGPPADIYSLGCVLYEMLTGQKVFRGSHINMLTQQIYVTPTTPSERAPQAGIPAEVDALVLRMLAKRPEQRPSAAELLEELRRDRGRPRPAGYTARPLVGRAARMVSVPAPVAAPIDAGAVAAFVREAGEHLRVGIVGALDETQWLGIINNGMSPRQFESGDDPASVDVLLTAGIERAELMELVATTVPVVAVSGGARARGLTELIRLGVSEVVGSCEVDRLARTLRRAVHRGRRTRARRVDAS